jgi:hypothetical protein
VIDAHDETGGVQPDEVESEPHPERVHRPTPWDVQREPDAPAPDQPDEAAQPIRGAYLHNTSEADGR